MSLNQVILHGRLGQDVDLRYTQSGTAVASLSVATTDYKKNQNGQAEEVTDWHKVVAWGKRAETCSQYLKKGSGVVVVGKMKTRSWEDQNGQKRYTTEVVADKVDFTGKPENAPAGNQSFQPKPSTASANNMPEPNFEDIPF